MGTHRFPNSPASVHLATGSRLLPEHWLGEVHQQWCEPWVKIQIVPPVNIPIPTKIPTQMGGAAPTPEWDPKQFWPMDMCEPSPLFFPSRSMAFIRRRKSVAKAMVVLIACEGRGGRASLSRPAVWELLKMAGRKPTIFGGPGALGSHFGGTNLLQKRRNTFHLCFPPTGQEPSSICKILDFWSAPLQFGCICLRKNCPASGSLRAFLRRCPLGVDQGAELIEINRAVLVSHKSFSLGSKKPTFVRSPDLLIHPPLVINMQIKQQSSPLLLSIHPLPTNTKLLTAPFRG